MDFIREIVDKDFFFHHSLTSSPMSDLFSLHMHDAFEILLLIKGHAKVNIEDKVYKLSPNDLYFIYPGSFHRVLAESDTPYERKVIRFDYSFSRQFDPQDILIGSLQDFTMIRSEGIRKTGILSLFDQLSRYLSYDDATKRIGCISVLSSLLLEISEAAASSAASSFSEKISGSPANDRVAAIIEFINDHLTEDLPLDRIAGEFYISKFYMSRLFRESTGSSIGNFIIKKRLILAKRLIFGGATPRSACIQSGFADYSSFFKHYKKYFGTAPSA